MDEITNLNITLTKKNEEINFLTDCDKKQLEDHKNSENNLRKLIAKLEDKIFTIQRENELELYEAIERLKNQYDNNLRKAKDEWDDIRVAHNATLDNLKKTIADQKKEIELLNNENIVLEGRHSEMARDHEHSVQMFSQKVLAMESEMGQNLKNYTTSMKQIEDDAKVKLDDLHSAIKNKNTENEILNAQITLKNGEITHLLEEIDRLREINREKLKKLESTNAYEQDALNNQIADMKKTILQLKSKIHELDGKIADDEAAHQLASELLRSELQG
jgi:chromosome segregation ATPase